MSNLSDLPLVRDALQALAPVKIEPKVVEHCCLCGRARKPNDFKWNLLQYSIGDCRPICNSCEDGLVLSQVEPAFDRELELGDMKSKFDREDSAI